ncbi:hypothetical protein PV326_007330 [Microctonus aethiopoides]|nr:hypothetical protein PV326_007330 [Microctonus aethiopoides]
MDVAAELSPLSGGDAQPKLMAERTSYYVQSPDKRPENRRHQVVSCLRHNALTILTISGVIGGIVLGLILRNARSDRWTEREIMYVNYVGELFLRMLKSLILPLIIASLISAIGSLDLSLSGKIGARAITYYMVTTVSAVVLGIILVITIQPGKHGNNNGTLEGSGTSRNVSTVDTLMDLVRNMFPPNLVQACISQHRTVLTRQPNNTSDDISTWKISSEDTSGMNILGLVVFATVLGITLGKMGPSGKPLLGFFEALSSAMMIITNWALARWCTFSGDFKVLPLIFFLLTKKNPVKYILNMAQAIATAFGTSSSSATLPVAIGCLEDRNGIDSRVSRFIMPIGATINMDGTALYEAVAAIFIAQILNVVGDSLGAGIVNHLSKNELAALPHNVQSQNGPEHSTTSI